MKNFIDQGTRSATNLELQLTGPKRMANPEKESPTTGKKSGHSSCRVPKQVLSISQKGQEVLEEKKGINSLNWGDDCRRDVPTKGRKKILESFPTKNSACLQVGISWEVTHLSQVKKELACGKKRQDKNFRTVKTYQGGGRRVLPE